MNKKILFSLSFLLVFLFASCTNEPEESRYVPDEGEILNVVEENGFTKISFLYPSVDAANDPVGVSGIICMKSSFYKAKDKHADYTILVSHGATTKWDDCPSEDGGSELCSYLSGITEDGQKVIGIAPDYLGLGASRDELQAFAYGEVNGKASLDALIWGRKILKDKGFSWENKVANVGFSQGGQTAICVQKLVDTSKKYKDIKITKTYAGDGVYDIQTMIEASLDDPTPILPSVVLLGIASFNRVFDLGIDESAVFKEPQAVEDYLMSKEYGLLDSMKQLVIAASLKAGGAINLDNYRDWSHYLKPSMLKKDSALYKKIMKTIKPYNNFWTPKADSRIVLFTAVNDDVVPSANSEKLFEYFVNSGNSDWSSTCKTDNIDTAFSNDNIYICYREAGESTLDNIIHDKASNRFKTKVIEDLIYW